MIGGTRFTMRASLVMGLRLGVVWILASQGAGCGGGPDTALGSRRQLGAPLPGRDCNPFNALGAVSEMERAMLDTIAEAEGTLGRGEKDGYDVMFTYRYFDSCERHPGVKHCSGRLCSTAAGRYQFLKTTWEGLEMPNFWPENQDRGALALLAKRGIRLPNRVLRRDEFNYVMERLSFLWSSLPPGRYGQPAFSYEEAWERYCAHAACDGAVVAERAWPDWSQPPSQPSWAAVDAAGACLTPSQG